MSDINVEEKYCFSCGAERQSPEARFCPMCGKSYNGVKVDADKTPLEIQYGSSYTQTPASYNNEKVVIVEKSSGSSVTGCLIKILLVLLILFIGFILLSSCAPYLLLGAIVAH